MERAIHESGQSYRAQISVGAALAETAFVLESVARFDSLTSAVSFAQTTADTLFPPGSLKGRSLTAGVSPHSKFGTTAPSRKWLNTSQQCVSYPGWELVYRRIVDS